MKSKVVQTDRRAGFSIEPSFSEGTRPNPLCRRNDAKHPRKTDQSFPHCSTLDRRRQEFRDSTVGDETQR